MNSVRSPQSGYTIVETMIFLAISGMMLISAMALISGQQQKTEFNQAIRDVNSQIQDVMNDVATGYYSNPGNFTCTYSPTGPSISAVASTQGTNSGCTFVGRAISFGEGGNATKYSTFNVAGNRLNGANNDSHVVTNTQEALPKLIFPQDEATNILPGGMTVGCVAKIDCATESYGMIAFMTTFSPYDETGKVEPGSQATDVYPILGTSWSAPTSKPDMGTIFANYFASTSPATIMSNGNKNPASGMKVCFISGGTDQHANITIGANGSLTTELEVLPGKTC